MGGGLFECFGERGQKKKVLDPGRPFVDVVGVGVVEILGSCC